MYTASEEEVAAALAAIRCVLAETSTAQGVQPSLHTANWQAAAILEHQGLVSGRTATYATWATAERAGREGRWSPGIV